MVNTLLAAIFIVGFCLMGGLCVVWYEVKRVEKLLIEFFASQVISNDTIGRGFIALHKELKKKEDEE
jgi:hypothetical protein